MRGVSLKRRYTPGNVELTYFSINESSPATPTPRARSPTERRNAEWERKKRNMMRVFGVCSIVGIIVAAKFYFSSGESSEKKEGKNDSNEKE